MDGDRVDAGGGAALVLFRVDGPAAYGVVIGTTDNDKLPLGTISLSVTEDGSMQISQYGQVTMLCKAEPGADVTEITRAPKLCGA